MARRQRSRVRGQGFTAGAAATNSSAAKVGGMPNVAYQRKELRDVVHLYDLIRDCIAGSHAVKEAVREFRAHYLPQPNATDDSEENAERFRAYLERAVFYNVTRRTLYALIGQIFLRDPQVTLPVSLDVLKLDANGENVTLEQIAKSVAMYALAYGRGGIHVDFPTTLAPVSVAAASNMDLRPIINAYEARDIINWRKALRGSRMVYTLIVVSEMHTLHDDGFEAKSTQQFKVMRLQPAIQAASTLATMFPDTWETDYGPTLETRVSQGSDVYSIEIWRTSGDYGQAYNLAERYFPKGADGQLLNEIPWMFVGSEKNDDSVDHPPLADLAELNIAHFRNSADYEETSFLTGQPTPYVTGVTEEWNTNVLKGNIQLGSRGVIALPIGAAAGLLQAEANGVPKEAMDAKERQMVALGAKLVEQREVQRTATEAQMEGAADTSILANIAQNVSTAVEWAVKKACVFTGDAPDSVSFILSTEFDLTRMDPAERQQLLLEWQGGAIDFSEMRANLRRGGIATLDDKEARTSIAKDEQLRNNALLEKNKILNANKPVGSQPNPAPGA